MSNSISTRSRTRIASTLAAASRRRSIVTPPPLTTLAGTVIEEQPSSPPSHSHSSPASPTTPSSENKCAICLSVVLNKCKTDSCVHEFCFGCLLEWSKVKAECPLCKKQILKISHNFRSGPNGQESFDEYHVPPNEDHYFVPPPTLSIRLAARFGSGPPLAHSSSLPFRRSNFEDFMESIIRLTPDPFASIASAPDTSGSSLQRDLTRHMHHNREFLRILEVGPMSTESRALNAFLTSNDDGFENPFYSIDDLEDGQSNPADGSQSYQRRRRIYDRQQWVAPFQSTLQAGTVFFHSVEYFRTHPTSYSRIKPWLRRELIVLLGLTTPRPSMAALYDVILSLLLRYDIRSREFREMIRIYFPNAEIIKHFQHEFYHFVVSGQSMEFYDRDAQYASSRINSNNNSFGYFGNSSRRDLFRPLTPPAPIPIITLDSDFSDSELNVDDQCALDPDPQPGPSSRIRASRRSNKKSCSSSRGRKVCKHNREHHHHCHRQANRIEEGESSCRSRDRSEIRVGLRRKSNGFWSAIDLSTATAAAEASTSQPTEVSRPSVIEPVNMPGSGNGNNSDDDDCQLLGIHPIVKPPPLAVITIDSDDDEPKSPKSTGAEVTSPDSDLVITSIHSLNKPSAVTAEPELLDIDEDSSSSSVHILTERPASPKPSTSAVLREIRENQFNLNSAQRAKRSDFLLTRLFEDLQKNEQDSSKRKWSESEDEEEVLDLEERNMQANGHKSRRLSSASSTVSRSVSTSPYSSGSGPQDLMAGQNQTQTAIDLSRDTGESPTLPSVLNNIMKVEGTDQRRWESDDDQEVPFDIDGNLTYFKPAGPFAIHSSSSSACSSRSVDSAGLVRVKRPRRSQNDDQQRPSGDDIFESVTFQDDLIDLSGFGSGGGGGLRPEPLTNDDMFDSLSLDASSDLDLDLD